MVLMVGKRMILQVLAASSQDLSVPNGPVEVATIQAQLQETAGFARLGISITVSLLVFFLIAAIIVSIVRLRSL